MPETPLRPKLVLFDLDDTLCDHDASLRLRLRLAFSEACQGLDHVDLDAMVEASTTYSVFGTDHFADLFAEFGVHGDERVQRAVEMYVSDRYRGLELFDEAREVVSTIKQHAHVGMITNGPSDIQRNKIARLQIADLFPFILVSEEVGAWKPDPVIFHRALELGEVTADEAVYIGDNPEHDVAGARAAGITSIWMNRREQPWPGGPEPDFAVRNLWELLPLLGFGEETPSSTG